ncbi:hypothetical protein BGZ70_001576, partial [Mortierella alpina]
MSTSPFTSIFDLPPVVDTICRYLHRRDYSNVSLVNKTFYNGCKRYIWRRLVFKNTEENEALPKEHRRALRANSHWIQNMTVSKTHPPLRCLTKSPTACRNLKFLGCSLEHRSSKYTKALAKLLVLNTDIIGLRIEFSDEYLQMQDEDQPPNIDGIKQVGLALPHLTSLQYISVETPGIFGHIDLFLFLTCLPPCVKVFKFMQLYPRDNEVDEAPYALTPHGLAWRDVYSDLVDLEFGEFEHYSLTPFLIPFLQRCPRLIRLTLPIVPGPGLLSIAEVLRGNCSKLRFLTIVGHLQEEHLLPIVDVIPALLTLDLPVSVPTTAIFLPQLVAKWSHTL